MEWINKIEERGGQLATLIHPTAYVSPKATINPGTVILPHALVNTDTLIERGCIINLGAILDHGCIIKEGVHICLGAIVKGENADHREDYKTKWVMYGARQGAKYDPFIGSGIPEVDLEADLMRELLDYKPQEPYKRTNRKIGANELCPCGSGKKFKKCCRGNGKYDQWEEETEIKQFVILGAGATDEQLLIQLISTYTTIVLDDVDPAHPLSSLTSYINLTTSFIPAFGNNSFRMEWINRIQQSAGQLVTLIHPTDYVSPTATISLGCVILPHAIVNTDVVINRGCIINLGAIVDHGCTIRGRVHICLGAVVKGENRIEKCSKIEAGEVVERGQYPL